MQLRSGRYKWPIRPMSFSEVLPNEMLETILLKLPTQDLLRCRGVSKLWKAFASPICRRRHVTPEPDLYEIFSDTEKLEAFYAIFEGSSDLPWSACSLKAYKLETTVEYEADYGEPLHYLDPVQLKRFVDAFGPHVRKLELNGDNLLTIVPALLEMPNLEVLVSSIKAMANDIPTACSGNRLQLSKLKRLEIVVHSEADIQLMEFMCTNARKLDSILVKLIVDDDEIFRSVEVFAQADLRRLISLVSKIPSIEFKLSNAETMDYFEELSVPELKVKDLKFHFDIRDDHQGVEYYREVEQFLANKSNCLEKLNMEVFNGEGLVGGPLGLPVFSKLKKLDIYCKWTSSSTSTSFLHPFVSNQFPNLVKVKINIPDEAEIDQGFVTVFGTQQFDSVKELTLGNDADQHPNPMVFDWGHTFPNLVKLTLAGVTLESHSYIYEKLTNLEHLCLRLRELKFIVTEVEPNRFTKKLTFVDNKDPEIITCGYPKNKKKNRGTAQTPSLSSLKNLKTLWLDFAGCREEEENFRDTSKIHLALLNLHQLDSVTFQHITISPEVKKRLSEYHGSVEVRGWF